MSMIPEVKCRRCGQSFSVIDETGTDLGWGNGAGVCVIEIHPWGTVPGASDFQTDKTTIVIFR